MLECARSVVGGCWSVLECARRVLGVCWEDAWRVLGTCWSMVGHAVRMLGACWSMPEVCWSVLWACLGRARSMLGHVGSVLGAWSSVLGAWWSMLWACCGCMLGACWTAVKAFNHEFARSGRRSRATICGASREGWIGRECLCGVNHSKRKAPTRVELYTTKLVGGCSQGNSRHTAPGGRYVTVCVSV